VEETPDYKTPRRRLGPSGRRGMTKGITVSDHSAIEWTETTWNPLTGCDRVSLGCEHCYAMRLAKRLKAMGSPKYQNDGDPRTSGPGFDVAIHPWALYEPYKWRNPRVVFVNSMSDLSVGVISMSGGISAGQRRYSGVRQVLRTCLVGAVA
jgi:Protein of unknown function (DUF5131)